MKNGICRVCDSKEIYKSDFAPLQAGEGRLHLFNLKGNDFPLEVYLCANCGYLEMSVAEGHRSHITELVKSDKWKKVG
jgi:predicted nucleic-acid-binding Zn-ribbon protein